MVKFVKQGKIVILLSGRYAGKKAVVVKVCEANKKRPFEHVLVAGIETAPRRVSPSMTKKQILKRTSVRVFIKFVNLNHVMFTRYNMSDIDIKSIDVTKADSPGEERLSVVKVVGKLFNKKVLERPDEKSRNTAATAYFFKKLRF